MSRPANPDWTVGSFATAANYPAGANPWNSNPTKVVPVTLATGFTPGQGAAAPNVNYLFNQLYVTQAAEKNTLTELVDFVGQMPALNWRRNGTIASGASSFTGAFYDKIKGAWYVTGLSSSVTGVHRSNDDGQTWGSNQLSAVGNGNAATWGDTDASGNHVVSTNGRYVYSGTASDVWTQVDAFGASGSFPDGTRVVYSPVHSLWCAIGMTTSTTLIATSPNRTTWTARTPSSNVGTTSNGPIALAMNPSTGRIVVAHAVSAVGILKVTASNDGGVTWSNVMTTSSGVATRVDICFDAVTNKWLLVAGLDGGTGRVYSSDDGLGWTQIATLSTVTLTHLSTIGRLWIANTSEPVSRMCHSVDGVTWKIAGYCAGSGSIVAGGGGLLVPDVQNSHTALRTGNPNLGTLT